MTGRAPTSRRQRALIEVALERAGMSVGELWMRYFALGGTAASQEVQDFVDGTADLPAGERDCLAVAVNERLDELSWRHRVPYADGPPGQDEGTGLLAALTDLLRGTHLAPPERVVAVLDEAAAHLGVGVDVYLADHGTETLVPLREGSPVEAVSIDSSLPGRCFQRLEAQTGRSGGQARLWLPIIDGVERLGVLEVRPGRRRRLDDPELHRRVWVLTHYLGHLLEATDRYGDALDRVRRRRPRTVSAELVWGLLPPMDAATDKVVVSGRLAPAHAAGGDVFDYALDEHTAWLTVLDATGHDLEAGMAAAAGLAAVRNARREGHGLLEQAEAVSRVLEDVGGPERFATGVMTRLDLDDGRLRYVRAGHPAPLLLRDGRVVRELDGGERPLLGLDAREASVAEEQLQPGDVVVVYTDGVVEARDAEGTPFGLPRLVDLVERQHADGTPLPEVLRRLFRAVLAHQRGVLQDDASVVLLHWTTQGQASLEPVLLA